jgi:hypothetical protein
VVDLPAGALRLVAVRGEPGLQAGVGVAQAIVGAEVPGVDRRAARQLAGGDPTLADSGLGHRDANLDVGVGVPEAVVANIGRPGGPDALVLQVAPERPQRLALGGGQFGDRHAGPNAQGGLWLAVLDLGVGVLGVLRYCHDLSLLHALPRATRKGGACWLTLA